MILHLSRMRRNVNRNVYNDRENVSATPGYVIAAIVAAVALLIHYGVVSERAFVRVSPSAAETTTDLESVSIDRTPDTHFGSMRMAKPEMVAIVDDHPLGQPRTTTHGCTIRLQELLWVIPRRGMAINDI